MSANTLLPMVDVIIPAYNYAHAIERAINSVKKQTLSNFACYIVDDGSTDDTADVVKEAIKDDSRFHYIYKSNGGVANARNTGVFSGVGKYICCLDADDALDPIFLEACVDAMESDRTISIAYTGLWFIKPDGSEGLSRWPEDFDYDKQLAGYNQIPTCNVSKREMWERLGGQRQRYAPEGAGEEDAEMWLRAGAYGFRAKKVTDAGLFIYSWMTGRVSGNRQHEVTDYMFYHPWTKDKQHPFASIATPERYSHPVRQYDEPAISVVIPVGSDHNQYIIDALDSLEAQTFRNWEVIVVDDLSEERSRELYNTLQMSYPYVNYVRNAGNHGAGIARNIGAKFSRGKFLVFLDADDWLHPNALDKMMTAWEQSQSIVYTDHFGKAELSREEANGLGDRLISYNEKTKNALFRHGWLPYDCNLAQRQPDVDMYHWCIITTLIPKIWHDEIGGFDEIMSSWEDWEYYIRMAKAGKCFYRLQDYLVVYRYYTGTRREDGLRDRKKLIQYMQNKLKGIKNMACGCSGNNSSPTPPTIQVNQKGEEIMASQDSDFVLAVYTHPNTGQHQVVGGATGTRYGYRSGGERFLVHVSDLAVQPNLFQRISPDNAIKKQEKEVPPPIPLTEVPSISKEDYDLQKVAGVSPFIAQELNSAGVYSIEELANFSIEKLILIKGIREKRAQAILESARMVVENDVS